MLAYFYILRYIYSFVTIRYFKKHFRICEFSSVIGASFTFITTTRLFIQYIKIHIYLWIYMCSLSHTSKSIHNTYIFNYRLTNACAFSLFTPPFLCVTTSGKGNIGMCLRTYLYPFRPNSPIPYFQGSRKKWHFHPFFSITHLFIFLYIYFCWSLLFYFLSCATDEAQ